MLYANFGWNWPSGSRLLWIRFVIIYWLFCTYLPLEKGGAHHLNKLDSPSPKDALCQVWLKLAQWFWRRRFFNFVNVLMLFHNYVPLEKGMVLHLINLKTLHPRMLCTRFGWKWPRDSEEEYFLRFPLSNFTIS